MQNENSISFGEGKGEKLLAALQTFKNIPVISISMGMCHDMNTGCYTAICSTSEYITAPDNTLVYFPVILRSINGFTAIDAKGRDVSYLLVKMPQL